jgi:hypothetical protein
MFNPLVRHFRIHFYSVRPCFNFSTGASLSDFAKHFMGRDKYYGLDPGLHQQPNLIQFSLRRLGRRCQYDFHDIETDNVLHAHKFWSAYFERVASSDYRGPWLGLAPLRAEFKNDKEQKLLRINKDVLPLAQKAAVDPSLTLRAFPKLYLCPIGWAAGVVVDIEGSFQFETLPLLVDLLRSDRAFFCRSQKDPVQIDQVLTRMHGAVRQVLLSVDRRHSPNETPRSYIVCSPIAFQGQDDFTGDQRVDLSAVLRILEHDPSPDSTRYLVSPTPRALTITRFNRGTLRITGRRDNSDYSSQSTSLNLKRRRVRRGEEYQSPQCALSNLKNCLLMTALMEQFHSDGSGHANSLVQKMREEVELTFAVLKSAWKSPAFHAICNRDSGLQRMLSSAVTNVYNFIQSKFEGVAIGDRATVLDNVDPVRRELYLSERRKGTFSETQEPIDFQDSGNSTDKGANNMGSKYSFSQNTMTNTAIGDNATVIVQGWDNDQLRKLAADILAHRPEIENKASTPEQKEDAKTIDAIRQEADKGNRSGVIEGVKKLGKWGWEILKELGISLAVEAIKQAVGL